MSWKKSNDVKNLILTIRISDRDKRIIEGKQLPGEGFVECIRRLLTGKGGKDATG